MAQTLELLLIVVTCVYVVICSVVSYVKHTLIVLNPFLVKLTLWRVHSSQLT